MFVKLRKIYSQDASVDTSKNITSQVLQLNFERNRI